MPASIENAWFTLFETEVHHQYQRMTSQFRPFVRTKSIVGNEKARFQRLSAVTGGPTQKPRNGEVIPVDANHSYVEVDTSEYYFPIWSDKIDELKTNIGAQQEYAKVINYGLMRQMDTVITDKLDGATAYFDSSVDVAAGSLTFDHILTIRQAAQENEIDLNSLAWAISPESYSALLGLDQFVSADYNTQQIPGAPQSFKWLGMDFFVSTALPTGTGATGLTSNFVFDKERVCLAVSKEPSIEVSYHPERVSTLINGWMSIGCQLIDEDTAATSCVGVFYH